MPNNQPVQRLAQAIRRNVDEWYADAVTYEHFSARQRRLWNRAQRAGITDDLTEAVAPKLGSLGARREHA